MHKKYVIALYIRLSVEDFKTESLSIPNQKLILREKAMSLPEWDNGEVLEFVDNGHTGTNFERPAVQELLTMVQAGKIDCIIVKDLSRFGRNSIETGYFIERVFPLYHTRFISVSDDFDTANFKGDTGGIDVAFKYLISECYSRDMSMKTKSAGENIRVLSVLMATARAQTGVWSRTRTLQGLSGRYLNGRLTEIQPPRLQENCMP